MDAFALVFRFSGAYRKEKGSKYRALRVFRYEPKSHRGRRTTDRFGVDLGPIDGTSLRFGWAEVDDAGERIERLRVASKTLSPDRTADRVLGSIPANEIEGRRVVPGKNRYRLAIEADPRSESAPN